MDGAIGIAKFIVTETRLIHLRRLQQERAVLDRAVATAERATSRVLHAEKEAQANLAKRQQFEAQARDAMLRMEKNPGVRFFGYESPARRRLGLMQQSMASHQQARTLAKERARLARREGVRARTEHALARAALHRWQRANGLEPQNNLDLDVCAAEQQLQNITSSLKEAEIDEAVMRNQVRSADAARVRQALRCCPVIELER